GRADSEVVLAAERLDSFELIRSWRDEPRTRFDRGGRFVHRAEERQDRRCAAATAGNDGFDERAGTRKNFKRCGRHDSSFSLERVRSGLIGPDHLIRCSRVASGKFETGPFELPFALIDSDEAVEEAFIRGT